jgi:hypothetical protein
MDPQGEELHRVVDAFRHREVPKEEWGRPANSHLLVGQQTARHLYPYVRGSWHSCLRRDENEMPEAFHCSVFSASPDASVTSLTFTYDMHHNLLSPTRSTPAVEGPEQLQALQAEAPDVPQSCLVAAAAQHPRSGPWLLTPHGSARRLLRIAPCPASPQTPPILPRSQ